MEMRKTIIYAIILGTTLASIIAYFILKIVYLNINSL